MLQVPYIRENKDLIIQRLKLRNLDAAEIIDKIIDTDKNRRETQKKLDETLASSNAKAKEIGMLFKQGKGAEANALKEETSKLKEESKQLQETFNNYSTELTQLLYQVPNVPNEIVPEGNSDEDNVEIFTAGTVPTLHDEAQPHWELTKKYSLIDFELGVKISGAGFPVYTGKGARIQRALVNFFLDNSTEMGYREVQPPLLINETSGYGTGQLPDKEGQMYHVGADDLYLIPTAEVPVTNIYRDVILDADQLPIKNTAYSQCFRREAGSYGSDVRGLNRLHQFDKVEIVQLVHPSKSYEALEEMVEYVKTLLEKLELPYRIVRLCGGDLGFTSALTYDFEVYSAAQDKWLEVSSVSNFETFQANRLKCRYRDENGKPQLVHTLNGSALAFPRILAALLENNQTPDGIKIPKALAKYTGFDMIS
ncbi:serine--tRNA ligase [bacterium SCSIO 12643]|nr:serine--tRNA ligase [bacterium SCSIO 12643]